MQTISLENNELYFELQDNGYAVKIEPIEVIRSNSNLDWDKNWVRTRITINGGAFSGWYIADFMTIDFEALRQIFDILYNDLNGMAVFADLEGALKLEIQGDGLGHFNVNVTACEEPCFGSTLNLTISFDQTYIKPLINQLSEIIKRFPIIGNLGNPHL